VVVVYLDILVSRNAADRLRDLKLVLNRLQAGNWYLKRKVLTSTRSHEFWGTSMSSELSPDHIRCGS
jgi:hypothetical protein